MLSKAEAESIVVMEAHHTNKKKKNQNDKERFVMDGETICMVDEEDVEHNSSCDEDDNNAPAMCHKLPDDAQDDADNAGNSYANDFLSGIHDGDHSNDDDNESSLNTNASQPEAK